MVNINRLKFLYPHSRTLIRPPSVAPRGNQLKKGEIINKNKNHTTNNLFGSSDILFTSYK